MSSLLLKLANFQITTEIWLYLEVIDIIHLMETSKNINELCIQMNKIVGVRSVKIDNMENETQRFMLLRSLSKSFPNISKLSLNADSGHHGDIDGVFEESIDINTIFGESLSVIYNCESLCKSLTDLHMNVRDGGLEGISNLKNLKSLNLRRCNCLSYSELYHISLLENIISLDLSYTDVLLNSDSQPPYLSRLTNLTSLNLHHCDFDEGMVSAILSPLTNLKHLFVGSCDLTIQDFEIISSLPNLTDLNLAPLKKGDVVIIFFGVDKLSHLSCLNKLKKINISNCIDEGVNGEGLMFLRELTSLTSLELKGGHKFISDAGIANISNLTNLTYLNLVLGVRISDVALSHLTRLTNLQTLDLNNCYKISDNGLAFLSNLNNLTNLNLSYCEKITDNGLQFLSNLSNLKYLDLHFCGKITHVGLSHLSKLTNLTIDTSLNRILVI